MARSSAGAWIALPLLCACVPEVLFTPRGGSCPKRPENCAFELISRRPQREYEVIGVLDLEVFAARKIPNDDASFRAVVADEVCRAGGDAVIPGINGNGRYVLATVVKWVDIAAQGPACPKATPRRGG
jgi:hypothetical protein